ncbi:unnamed protein product [Effrenium voratum]|nr:unnamed protein product [Effrenium voratum]
MAEEGQGKEPLRRRLRQASQRRGAFDKLPGPSAQTDHDSEVRVTRTGSKNSHLSADSGGTISRQSSLDPTAFQEELSRDASARKRPSQISVVHDRLDKQITDLPAGARSSRRIEAAPLTPERALAALPIFQHCREAFINLLAAGGEQVLVKPGEFRDLRGQAAGPGDQQGKVATAVVVLSGTFRLEISNIAVESLSAGQAFGFGDLLAAGSESYAQRAIVSAVSLRAMAPKSELAAKGRPERNSSIRPPCSYFMLRASTLRRGLQQFPAVQAIMQPYMGAGVDFTKPLLEKLQCNDAAKVLLARSSTRHAFCAGETVVTQGRRKYEGVILLLRGCLSVQIDGVEARRIQEGEVLGEEMLMNVTSKWRYSLCCLSFCDLVVLHRRPFVALVREAKPLSSSEEGLECQRLKLLLEGPWRQDQVIVSLPLFHGFSSDVLSVLPQLMETRVVLPGQKIWDSSPEERSLFLLLHGTAEEIITTFKKRRASQVQSRRTSAATAELVRTHTRALCAGACEGGSSLLGLRQVGQVQVLARTIAVAAVLHRPVFLHLLHKHNVTIQAPEMLSLLSQELDQDEPEEKLPTVETLESALPILRGLDEAFMASILRGGSSCFYMEGQQLCPPHMPSESLFVVIRGEICTSMAGIPLERYRQGQALHILALAGGFVPSFESRCLRLSEVWALPREVLMTSLDHYPSMKRILAALTAMQVSRLTTVAGSLPGTDSPLSGSTSPKSPQSPKANRKSVVQQMLGSVTLTQDDVTPIDLVTVPLFAGACFDLLRWVQENLEPRIFFSDETLFCEGDKSDCFYIVCKGMVCLESSGGSQVTYTKGASFGEAHLLGVSEGARATAVCLETSLIQVLHRRVFLQCLKRFPSEVQRFDHLAVKWLDALDGNAMTSVPMLQGCSEGFLQQLAQRTTTRLLHKGAYLVEKNALRGSLCLIRCGSASTEDHPPSSPTPPDDQSSSSSSSDSPEKRYSKWDVVNAELVLGLEIRAPHTVKADGLLAITEIQDTDFINILQAFPDEVPGLVARLSGLWPQKAEQVPFLSGMSQAHFSRLMQEAKWDMIMADRTVVRQGKEGDALHLLCYGIAVRAVDDVVLGKPIAPGEVINRANFLGLAHRYPVTIRTQTVCHFRTLRHTQLQKLLESQLTLREWFELAKVQARNFSEYDHAQKKVAIFRAKMRRRTEQAFNKHVQFMHANRARAQGATASKARHLVEKFLCSRSPSHSEDWAALQDVYSVMRRQPQQLGLPTSSQDGKDVELLSALSGCTSAHEEAELMTQHRAPRVPTASSSVVLIKQRLPSMKGNWSVQNGDLHQIQGAIHAFCRQKEKENLKGRLLRIMRNNYETGNATLDEDEELESESEEISQEVAEVVEEPQRRKPPRLNREELQKLDQLLPALPPKADSQDAAKSLHTSLGQALHRKFQRLTKVTSKRKV